MPRRLRLAIWSDPSGITMLIRLRRGRLRFAAEEYALSAITHSGVRRGALLSRRGTMIPSRTCASIGLSPACPGVSSSDKPRPFPSTTKWALVVSPPRERPIAWSTGSSSRFAKFDEAPARRGKFAPC